MAKSVELKCQHCRAEGPSGTRGGCLKCGKVKTTRDGKKHVKQEQGA
jgi:hypothetical protein